MPYKLVRDVILAKAKEQFGTAELYGSDRTKIVVNPSEETERLPWRYSYNLPTEEARIEEQERMDAFYRPIFEEIMRERFSDGKCAPFEKIYLATTNCCNGKCGFCPAGNDKSMRPVFLSSEILEKLISELCSCSFTGKISLHGVNEPLLDPRLEDICRMFKTRLPECRLQILTNGKLLTLDRLRNLLPVTDQIDIHVYDDRLSVPDRLKDSRLSPAITSISSLMPSVSMAKSISFTAPRRFSFDVVPSSRTVILRESLCPEAQSRKCPANLWLLTTT